MMRQGIQTNFEHPTLRTWGCYFFTLCRLAEILRAKMDRPGFTDREIIKLYEYCVEVDWITGNCWILQPENIMNYLQGHTIFRGASHSSTPPPNEYFPVYFKQERLGRDDLTHFALGTRDAEGGVKIEWDSWTPSAIQRLMPLHSYRWLIARPK